MSPIRRIMPRPVPWLLCLLVFAFGFLGRGAEAGPWPRQVRHSFVSLSVEQDRAGSRYGSLYAEYGLGARTTLGLEVGGADGERSVLLWGQRVLGKGAGPNRWTASMGIGAVRRDDRTQPMATAGAAWGRGWDSLPGLRRIPGGGWVAVETRLKMSGGTSPAAAGGGYLTPSWSGKADVTIGWHARPTLMLIGQLRFEDRDDSGFSSKVALSAVQDIAGPLKLELGLVAPLAGGGEAGVKIGSWIEF